jgi:hypothetical protein
MDVNSAFLNGDLKEDIFMRLRPIVQGSISFSFLSLFVFLTVVVSFSLCRIQKTTTTRRCSGHQQEVNKIVEIAVVAAAMKTACRWLGFSVSVNDKVALRKGHTQEGSERRQRGNALSRLHDVAH